MKASNFRKEMERYLKNPKGFANRYRLSTDINDLSLILEGLYNLRKKYQKHMVDTENKVKEIDRQINKIDFAIGENLGRRFRVDQEEKETALDETGRYTYHSTIPVYRKQTDIGYKKTTNTNLD